MVTWTKDGCFWVRGDGVIDRIYNSLTKYRKEGDYSSDAICNFIECTDLLVKHKRYEDRFIRADEVKVWWMFWVRRPFRKLWVKLGGTVGPMRRKQNDMTRDPYKAYGCMYAFLYRHNKDIHTRAVLTLHFNMVSIPFRLRRGGIQRWWKRFKRDNRPHYVIRMDNWVGLGTHDWYEAVHTNDFYKDTEER